MADVPYCIIDYIMKFAGAYSQHPDKKDYLEDIKLIIHPHRGVKQALNTVKPDKYLAFINYLFIQFYLNSSSLFF